MTAERLVTELTCHYDLRQLNPLRELIKKRLMYQEFESIEGIMKGQMTGN